MIKRVVERALQIPREAKHGRRDRKAYRPRRWAIKSYRHGDKIINAENALSISTKSALVGIKARERIRKETIMPQTIDREQVQQMMQQGAQLVEVLERSQYRQAHLPEAINMPLKALSEDTAAKLEKDKPVIVYCYDYQ